MSSCRRVVVSLAALVLTSPAQRPRPSRPRVPRPAPAMPTMSRYVSRLLIARLLRRIDRVVSAALSTMAVMTSIFATSGSPPAEVGAARLVSMTQANVDRSASTLCPQAGRLRDNVKIRIDDRPNSPAVATMEKDREPDGTPITNAAGDEQWTLTVYSKRVNGQARFPKLQKEGDAVSGEYLECALRGLTSHELMRQCVNDSGDTYG